MDKWMRKTPFVAVKHDGLQSRELFGWEDKAEVGSLLCSSWNFCILASVVNMVLGYAAFQSSMKGHRFLWNAYDFLDRSSAEKFLKDIVDDKSKSQKCYTAPENEKHQLVKYKHE